LEVILSLLGFYKGSLVWDDRGLIPIGDEEFFKSTPKAYVDPDRRFAFGFVGSTVDRIPHPFVIGAYQQVINRLQTHDVTSDEVKSSIKYLEANAGTGIFMTRDKAWYFDKSKIFVVDPDFPVAFGTGASSFIAACLLGDTPEEAGKFAGEFDQKTSAIITFVRQSDLEPFNGVPVKKPRASKKGVKR